MPRPREFDEQQVLDRAMEQFWAGSYTATSTDQLCESTGLSRSSLYNAFSGKSELYLRVLENYHAERGVEQQRYLDLDESGRDALVRLLLDILTGQCATDDRRTCMIVNAAVEIGRSDDDVAELVRRDLARFEALLAALIARGQRDGSLSDRTPPAELAPLVHATFIGLQVGGRVSEDPDRARAVVDTLLAQI